MKAIMEHKWKAAIVVAIGAAGLFAYLYKTKGYIPPPATLLGQSNKFDLRGFKEQRKELEEAAKKDRNYKLFVTRVKQKVKENMAFVESRLSLAIPILDLNALLNKEMEFATSQPLEQALGYVFSSLLLQRIIHLVSIAKLALFTKESLNRKLLLEEEKGSSVSPIASCLVATSKSDNKTESALFFKTIVSFIGKVSEEVSLCTREFIKKEHVTLTIDEGRNIFNSVFGIIKDKYCAIELKKGGLALDLESYCIELINLLVREMDKENASSYIIKGEIEELMESVYFQSLLMQGLDMDLYNLNAEYQKLFTLVLQGNPPSDRINNRDIVAAILKSHKEYLAKSFTRFVNEVDADNEVDYLDKMLKFIKSELNSTQGPAVSESYKQSLKDFIWLILFEELNKNDLMGSLPPFPGLNFLNQ